MPEVRAELHNGRANGLRGLRSRKQAVQGELLRKLRREKRALQTVLALPQGKRPFNK
jgi:hypothetical protein